MGIKILLMAQIMLIVSMAFASPGIPGLEAKGPDPGLADKLQLFGQFVGDWEFDMILHRPDGSRPSFRGTWHFGWVLAGRAIQDVWIVPPQHGMPGEHGTTIRFYDPEMDAWRVAWAGPVKRYMFQFTARKAGDEIVMEGTETEELSRWIFSQITPNSFHWRAVASTDGGKNWILEQEMAVRRIPAKP